MDNAMKNIIPKDGIPDNPPPIFAPPRPRYGHNFVPAPGEVEFAVCSKCGIVVGAAPKSREHFERERNLIEKGCQFK